MNEESSARAVQILRTEGFEAYALTGGLQAWQSGYPDWPAEAA